mmetsp:Transcript_26113/g.66294  ORF Transcript_26113/g.66294 Transcript_26113/m.66294 type:complete len:208 (-) Transcript_26113:3270-3893(-)
MAQCKYENGGGMQRERKAEKHCPYLMRATSLFPNTPFAAVDKCFVWCFSAFSFSSNIPPSPTAATPFSPSSPPPSLSSSPPPTRGWGRGEEGGSPFFDFSFFLFCTRAKRVFTPALCSRISTTRRSFRHSRTAWREGRRAGSPAMHASATAYAAFIEPSENRSPPSWYTFCRRASSASQPRPPPCCMPKGSPPSTGSLRSSTRNRAR